MDFRLDQFAHAWRSVEERRIEFERGDLGGPTQPCLRAFEDEKFEEQPVIVHRDAPFLIVITDGWFGRSPGTTRHNVYGLTEIVTDQLHRIHFL